MCAIFGSKTQSEFVKLADLNKSRGGISYSIMGFDGDMCMSYLTQNSGEFNRSKAKEAFNVSKYCIGHIQAPTNGQEVDYTIHPAHIKSSYLYHNGMIKSQSLSKYKSVSSRNWDTEIMLKEIINSESIIDTLSGIDGSFACALINVEDNSIRLFTNNLCTLYVNSRTMSISSTKFNKSQKLKSETILEFDPIKNELNELESFTTFDDIYFIPKEKS